MFDSFVGGRHVRSALAMWAGTGCRGPISVAAPRVDGPENHWANLVPILRRMGRPITIRRSPWQVFAPLAEPGRTSTRETERSRVSLSRRENSASHEAVSYLVDSDWIIDALARIQPALDFSSSSARTAWLSASSARARSWKVPMAFLTPKPIVSTLP